MLSVPVEKYEICVFCVLLVRRGINFGSTFNLLFFFRQRFNVRSFFAINTIRSLEFTSAEKCLKLKSNLYWSARILNHIGGEIACTYVIEKHSVSNNSFRWLLFSHSIIFMFRSFSLRLPLGSVCLFGSKLCHYAMNKQIELLSET